MLCIMKPIINTEYTNHVKVLVLFLIIASVGCSKGRNFEGSPYVFQPPNGPTSEGLSFIPKFIHEFRPNKLGFEFSVFLLSIDNNNGSNIIFRINLQELFQNVVDC